MVASKQKELTIPHLLRVKQEISSLPESREQ